MNLWKRLFGIGKTERPGNEPESIAEDSTALPAEDDEVEIKGSGLFEQRVVGESHYQSALERIVGGRSEESVELVVRATLVYENENPHDSQAIAVFIGGERVGYLSRADARTLRAQLTAANAPKGWPIRCDAVIVGGWSRNSGRDVGRYGVRLDFTR